MTQNSPSFMTFHSIKQEVSLALLAQSHLLCSHCLGLSCNVLCFNRGMSKANDGFAHVFLSISYAKIHQQKQSYLCLKPNTQYQLYFPFEFDTHQKIKWNTIQIRKSCSVQANSNCHSFVDGVSDCGQTKRKGTRLRFNLSSHVRGRAVHCVTTAKRLLLRRPASHFLCMQFICI